MTGRAEELNLWGAGAAMAGIGGMDAEGTIGGGGGAVPGLARGTADEATGLGAGGDGATARLSTCFSCCCCSFRLSSRYMASSSRLTSRRSSLDSDAERLGRRGSDLLLLLAAAPAIGPSRLPLIARMLPLRERLGEVE